MPYPLRLDWSRINWQAVEAIATVGAVVVALGLALGSGFLSWLRRPRLRITIENAPPDCHMTDVALLDKQGRKIATYRGYYLRLKVWNRGGTAAENVEVVIEEVRRLQEKRFERWNEFLPMNLTWAHKPGLTYLPRITPKLYKHCDLGRIINPAGRRLFGDAHDSVQVPGTETVLGLDLVVKPNTGTFLLARGTYRLRITAAAPHAKADTRWLELTITGQWSADEDTMRRDGVELRLI